MKRFVVMAALAAGIGFAGIAYGQVAASIYEGKFEGQGHSKVRVKVLETDGQLVVTSFAARHVAVTCEGGVEGQITKVIGRGETPVGSHGGFRFTNDDGDTLLKFAGEIGPPPSGKFRFSGMMDAGTEGKLECDSGRLFWSAR